LKTDSDFLERSQTEFRKESAMFMENRNPLRAAFAVSILLLTCLSIAAARPADEVSSNSVDAEALLRDAHGKTKSAATREDYEQIVRLCERARGGQPSETLRTYANELLAWTHNRLGELYADQAAELTKEGQEAQAAENDAKAMAEFQAAVGANPKYWKGHHNRGVSYALQRKFDEAVADFGRVVELRPQYANAWFNRGEIYFELGRYEEALSDYTQVLQLTPDDYDAHVRRGHTYFHLRRFREALADYDRAARLDPGKVEAVVNRGDANRNLGKWRQAAEDYQKAVGLDARSGRAYQSVAWLMATCPEEKYRKGDLAVQAAERAVTLDGAEDFKYLDTLAAAYANAGDFDKAQATIAEAIKIAPKEHRDALTRRLDLYKAEKPYREQE
jgi:tetratricopeptide (TPR) repeat protein